MTVPDARHTGPGVERRASVEAPGGPAPPRQAEPPAAAAARLPDEPDEARRPAPDVHRPRGEARDDAGNRARVPGHRHWVWWFLIGASALVLLVSAGLASLRMRGDPYTVVQATSDAIVVQPRDIVDFVALAVPRFGMLTPDRAFSGIVVDPPQRTDTVLTRLGMERATGQPDEVALVQRFEATAECQVSVERMVGPWMRVDVHNVAADAQGDGADGCAIAVELVGPAPEERRFVQESPVRQGHPASLQFRLIEPLRLRAFSVSGLAFTTRESREVKSAIRGAVVLLPDFGDRRDTVYAGDDLTLGQLQGEVAEVRVDADGIHTLFKGNASSPAIGSRPLAPSLLGQAFHTERVRFMAVLLVGTISLAMAIFQVVLRD